MPGCGVSAVGWSWCGSGWRWCGLPARYAVGWRFRYLLFPGARPRRQARGTQVPGRARAGASPRDARMAACDDMAFHQHVSSEAEPGTSSMGLEVVASKRAVLRGSSAAGVGPASSFKRWAAGLPSGSSCACSHRDPLLVGRTVLLLGWTCPPCRVPVSSRLPWSSGPRDEANTQHNPDAHREAVCLDPRREKF